MTKTAPKFQVRFFEVVSRSKGNGSVWESCCESKVKVEVDGEMRYEVAEGSGPVDSLANALRKALSDFTCLERVRLSDYRVEMVKGEEDTASSVKVYVQLTNGQEKWQSGAVSTNIVTASFHALVEGMSVALSRPPVMV